ncbi:hypothetical protein E5676_scaffold142G004600 [Cucumis melo var. makuwa]|uniref:Uncharacterized protein n=1 Tax=Cucumis melo var. makuwa TaxID=1194695 RepID=A0A5D3DID3_CUCMM|nr:hypothetical protein E6C27_scaffold460G00120 [Cucumis melo var. makuwa]TYK23394.1 hypothetical protein E5676_scaffold142G004600 [Cucumis melo var. makuwa]
MVFLLTQPTRVVSASLRLPHCLPSAVALRQHLSKLAPASHFGRVGRHPSAFVQTAQVTGATASLRKESHIVIVPPDPSHLPRSNSLSQTRTRATLAQVRTRASRAPTLPKSSRAPTLPKSSRAPTLPESSYTPTLPESSHAPTLPSRAAHYIDEDDYVMIMFTMLVMYAMILMICHVYENVMTCYMLRIGVSFGYTTDQFVLGVFFGSPKTRYVPTGSQIARVRERASSGAEVEVRARASWRLTRSDCSEP